jgi:hypothetical protein
MESLLKPVTLSPETDRVLGEIRAGAENALYGAESVESEKLFHKHVASLVEGAGLPVLQEMHYRWYLRELARLWRTRTGRDLAFHLELCIRKWVGLGLEPKTLQFLVCEAHQRLKGKSEGLSGNDECRKEPADVRSDTEILDSSHSIPRSLDLSIPGCMAGPRPPADPTAGSAPAPSPSPLAPEVLQ